MTPHLYDVTHWDTVRRGRPLEKGWHFIEYKVTNGKGYSGLWDFNILGPLIEEVQVDL